MNKGNFCCVDLQSALSLPIEERVVAVESLLNGCTVNIVVTLNVGDVGIGCFSTLVPIGPQFDEVMCDVAGVACLTGSDVLVSSFEWFGLEELADLGSVFALQDMNSFGEDFV
jgi:hypothetical protein